MTSSAKRENSTSKIDLYIGGFFGKNIKAGAWSSAALIPIVEMALDHVNNDSNILVDYQLKYVWRDSKVGGIYERKLSLSTRVFETRTTTGSELISMQTITTSFFVFLFVIEHWTSSEANRRFELF